MTVGIQFLDKLSTLMRNVIFKFISDMLVPFSYIVEDTCRCPITLYVSKWNNVDVPPLTRKASEGQVEMMLFESIQVIYWLLII